MIPQIFGDRHGGLLAKILPPDPAACSFGCPVPHGHVVQRVGAAPCLRAFAVVRCDGLSSEMKWHLRSSDKIIAAPPWRRGAQVSLGVWGRAMGSGHLCPCSPYALASLNVCMSGERENS